MINKNLKIALISLILLIIAKFISKGIIFFSQIHKINFVRNLFVIIVIFDICNIILQYILVKIYSNNVLEFVGMKFTKKSLKQLLVGIVIGTLMISIWVLSLRLNKIAEFKGTSSIYYNYIIISFFVTIIVGVVEEITFRGIILNQLMQFKGEIFAIIISSIIFSLFHTQYYENPIMLCYVFIFGAVCGLLYIITKSLYLSIGLHFATDFLFFVTNKIFILNTTVSNAKFGSYSAFILNATLLLVIISIKYYAAKSLHTQKQVEKNQPLD